MRFREHQQLETWRMPKESTAEFQTPLVRCKWWDLVVGFYLLSLSSISPASSSKSQTSLQAQCLGLLQEREQTHSRVCLVRHARDQRFAAEALFFAEDGHLAL